MLTNKVPISVRRLINLYNVLSHKQNSSYAEQIESFLHDTSDLNLRNKRWSILGRNARKGRDWKIDRNREQRLFQNPIQFGPNELKETKYLFKDQSQFRTKQGILPKSPTGRKNTSVYNADIESAINSYFNPLTSVPVHKLHQQVFKFYLQRLTNAPIMIVFKQRCNLFSPTSIDQWNQPYFEMRKKIRLENEKHKEMDIPPYEMKKVSHPDLLSLALKSENFMKSVGQDLDEVVKNFPWDDIRLVDDKLVNIINNEQQVKTLLRLDQLEISSSDENVLLVVDQATQMVEKSTITNIMDSFPYTLTYTRFFVLNILNLESDFTLFGSLWSNTDFEVVGARLALNDARIRSLLHGFIETADLQHASNYEDILKLAKTEETDTHGLNSVIQTIASSGLINTSLNTKTDALYLTKG